MDYVNNLYWIDGVKLINKAIEKRVERYDWEMWLSLYPEMSEETFVSFEAFKTKKQEITQKKVKLTSSEIIAKAEELKKIHQGTHEGIAAIT